MPHCHFLLAIVMAVMLIYKEFFKNMKISRMFLRIEIFKILIFCLFRMVIGGNIEVKEYNLW